MDSHRAHRTSQLPEHRLLVASPRSGAQNLRLQDVTVVNTSVTLAITVSKTDASGEGTSRSHTCICGGLQGAPTLTTAILCPACTVLRQQRLVSQIPHSSPTTPLCPTTTGGSVLKSDMVATIISAANQLNLAPPSSTSQAWGGHSLRRGGIQFLCRSNIDITKIQILARQALHSSTIFKYTDGLESLTGQKLATEAVSGSGLQQLQSQLQKFQSVFDSQTLHQPENACVSGTDPSFTDAPFVVATRLKAAIHAKCPYRPGRTKCGWAWSASRAIQHLSQAIHFHDPAKPDLAPICTRCQAALTDSDSSDVEVAQGASSTSGA